MSDHHDDQDTHKPGRTAGPDYVGYTVKDRGEGKEPFWLAIGGAWKHDDGKGMTLMMDAAPLDGRITLREKRREDYEAQREGQSQQQDRSPDRGR